MAGATVRVAGSEQTTDPAGRFAISAGTRPDALMDVVADGFLERQTTFGRGTGSGRVSLWPRTSPTGLDEKFTQEIVYTGFGEEAVLGATPLRRWRSSLSPIRVVLGTGFDPSLGRTVDNQVDAVRQMNELLGGYLEYLEPEFSDEEPDAGVVIVKIDPDDPSCDAGWLAFARVYYYENREIGKADIIYCTIFQTQRINVVRHEFGHSLGLFHSFDDFDLMYPYDTAARFTEREHLVVQMMYQRPAGNLFPDNDREATAALGRMQVRTLVCPH